MGLQELGTEQVRVGQEAAVIGDGLELEFAGELHLAREMRLARRPAACERLRRPWPFVSIQSSARRRSAALVGPAAVTPT